MLGLIYKLIKYLQLRALKIFTSNKDKEFDVIEQLKNVQIFTL